MEKLLALMFINKKEVKLQASKLKASFEAFFYISRLITVVTIDLFSYMRHLFLTVLLIASMSFNIIGLMIVSNLLKEFVSPYLLICSGLVLLFVTLILYLKR